MVIRPKREPKRTPFGELMQEENFLRPCVLSQSFVHPSQSSDTQEKWSDAEIRVLIEFVLFYSKESSWPTHKCEVFWNSDIEFMRTRAETSVCRSGK